MRLFGDAKVLRGSIAWNNVLRPGVPVFQAPREGSLEASPMQPAPAEYDEEGRRWVFRFPQAVAPRYTIERDRLFEYMSKHRLPAAGARQIRRDMRNCAEFFTDVRDLQTHADVLNLERASAPDTER